MTGAALSFDSLLTTLSSAIDEIEDPRKPSNATRYSVKDAVMGAFSCFFMQSESFLDYQRQLNSRSGQDNAQSLFGLEQIPSVEQIRNILDKLSAS
ncbi:MAG: fatty-acid synthase, partial [Cyanobacteria bacterium J06649_4]